MHKLPAIQYHAPLTDLNTFGLQASAHALATIQCVDNLKAVQAADEFRGMARLILGGGSNIVLKGDFAGLVLRMAGQGIGVVAEDDSFVYVRAQAGESWHALVLWTLAHGFGGLENLALIPGSVGASPVQNIGAYGAELKDCFHAASVFDFDSGEVGSMTREACQFGYRDSFFKHAQPNRFVILDVTFALPKIWSANLGYAELARELESQHLVSPTPQDIGAAVMAIRRRKLPDPACIGNAGSFFKNPVVSAEQRAAIRAIHPALVSHRQEDGRYKLAAGWL
ncbi:MAG: UDP-N-acetylmuramate dehydrogenase, partial [Janthinobacterium lividum]